MLIGTNINQLVSVLVLFNFSNACYMDWSKRHFWSYQETFPVSIIKLNLQFSLNLMQEISYAANLCEIFAIHLCMCKVTKNTVPPCSALMCSFIFSRSFNINLQWLHLKTHMWKGEFQGLPNLQLYIHRCHILVYLNEISQCVLPLSFHFPQRSHNLNTLRLLFCKSVVTYVFSFPYTFLIPHCKFHNLLDTFLC